MNDGHDPTQAGGPRRVRKVDREEQGDLLAEAMTGFFDLRSDVDSTDGPEEETAGERASPSEMESQVEVEGDVEAEPEVEVETGAGVGEGGEGFPEGAEGAEVEVIPDSPWERKMAWAKERAREGRLEEARELYLELVEDDPANVRALNNLGVLLDEMGDSEGAVSQLRAAKKIDPHNQEILGNLGAALGAMGKYSEAEAELRLAFRLDPTNVGTRANLGILLFRRGLYDQAAAELAVVCASKPDDGTSLFYMGEALNRLGRVDEAIQALERVTDLIPGNHRAYYTLGLLFDKKNVPAKAAAMYRKARELTAL